MQYLQQLKKVVYRNEIQRNIFNRKILKEIKYTTISGIVIMYAIPKIQDYNIDVRIV